MKTLFTILITIGVLTFGSFASAGMIRIIDDGVLNGTGVGYVDVLRAADTKAGNPTAEEAWINSILDTGSTVTYTIKTETVRYYSTNKNDTTFAFSSMNSDPRPDYFLVKNAQFMALFENIAYVGWGVFDINDILLDMNLGEWDEETGFTISHVTEFISDGDKGICNPNIDPSCLPAVPVPPAVWLFSSGLIGLVAVSRRRSEALRVLRKSD